jgi:hypothetical protein
LFERSTEVSQSRPNARGSHTSGRLVAEQEVDASLLLKDFVNGFVGSV